MWLLLRLGLVATVLYLLFPRESLRVENYASCFTRHFGSAPRLASEPQVVLVRVKSGETVISIARKWKSEVNDIIALNKLSDPNDIRTGQMLRVITGVNDKDDVAPPDRENC